MPTIEPFFRRDFQEGKASVAYPSPWWDISARDMPKTIKEVFAAARHAVITNGLIASAIRKMALYPLTGIVIDEKEEEGFGALKAKWEVMLFRTLNLHKCQLQYRIDRLTYGNAFISILYPFIKMLVCTECSSTFRVDRLLYKKDWYVRDLVYHLRCPKCKHEGIAKVEDQCILSAEGIKLVRWSPFNIDLDTNPITNETEYYYTPPEKLRRKVLAGSRAYLETLPSGIIQAIKKNRPFVLNKDSLYHFKEVTPSQDGDDDGWGYPIILAAMRSAYHGRLMEKGQEAILHEHIQPLDILFPATSDAAGNPFTTINLADWSKRVEAAVLKWRRDPNYKPVMPIPIGHQRIGGNGRALLMTQEMRVQAEHTIASMMVPQEFVFGGLSYSGSSVSLRMLETLFTNEREDDHQFVQHWLIPRVARFMQWTEVSVHQKPFKMADDIQMKQIMMNLAANRQISYTTLLSEFGRDWKDEVQLIRSEQSDMLAIERDRALAQAQMQAETQRIATMSMSQQQSGQQDPNAQAQPGQAQGQPAEADAEGMADGYARQIAASKDPNEQRQMLDQFRAQPTLMRKIEAYLQQYQTQDIERPLPEQRPPRRQNAPV